ncbi:unnamed protein product [Choristocarpus tenellus]
MESVIYAGQKFEEPFLGSSERRGFILGDGAGVGKGRQLAAMIYDAWRQGHKKHVWLSISADLEHDARRDISDIGVKEMKTFNISNLAYSNLDKNLEGVMFCTYHSLIMSTHSNGKNTVTRRLDQLVEWLGGEDCTGCIVFDEGHKAKNLYHHQQPSKMGLRVKQLQEMCPNARVVYCSATPCSEPRNMAYMTRVGLWGPGTNYEDFQRFLSSVDNRGVGAMELVAIHLKSEGSMLCRTLSYQGCNFDLCEIGVSDTQVSSW